MGLGEQAFRVDGLCGERSVVAWVAVKELNL